MNILKAVYVYTCTYRYVHVMDVEMFDMIDHQSITFIVIGSQLYLYDTLLNPDISVDPLCRRVITYVKRKEFAYIHNIFSVP